MIKSSSLRGNVISNIAQVIFSTFLIFALYRYANDVLGIEQLGIWSVVLASVSASRLADMGLSAGVTRFVARDLANNNIARAAQVIDTVTVAIILFASVVLILLHPLLSKLLTHTFQENDLTLALSILPFALISLWLSMIATVFQSGIDGCQRMEIRAALVVTGQLLLLLLSFIFLPKYGLLGLAYAQIGQSLFLLVFGRFFLQKIIPTVKLIPYQWKNTVIKEMLGYGANLQVASLAMLVFDPITKILIAKFGGASAAGYFEVINQMITRLRALIISANQAIIPHVATLQETKKDNIAQFYQKNMQLLIPLTLSTFTLLLIWSEVILWLVTNESKKVFIILQIAMICGWAINTFSASAYFINIGAGSVGWNTITHIMIGIINLLLGWILGAAYGTHGVISAYVISLTIGSFFLILIFHRKYQIKLQSTIFRREHLWIVVTSISVIYAYTAIQYHSLNNILLPLSLVVLSLILCTASWYHPARRVLIQVLRR